MTQELIRVSDQYYILASSALADARTRVLKHGETFAVFDRSGDIQPVGRGEQGIYHEGTRFLSRLVLRVAGKRPLLLSSTVKDDNALLAVDMANPDVFKGERRIFAADVVHVFRSALLYDGSCFLRLRLRNYAAARVSFPLTVSFAADFADIFEVRGLHRVRRGEVRPAECRAGVIRLPYRGLDGVERTTVIELSPKPHEASHEAVEYLVELEPGETATFYLTVRCETGSQRAASRSYDDAAVRLRNQRLEIEQDACTVTTANEQFNMWLARSRADLSMMLTDTPYGLYPYAGVPWFSTPFGRDGIITALETLWLQPSIARGVLAFAAAHQATEVEPSRDAEPGKIFHELRRGEMAALGEVPFGLYYGSVDVTPLFVHLAAEYLARTDDVEFIRHLWPHIEAALSWIDDYGDFDGDGFVEYRGRSEGGLVNQGWKDSHDSVFHADGNDAVGPIALCEVQAYVYAARLGAAHVARRLERLEVAGRLQQQAEELRARFLERFWDDRLQSFVLALDGEKRPCRVRASNAGHCLFAGIADAERARMLGRTLFDEASFSGWGLRTLSAGERRYNPMSYHNGSVWPHDNALIAAGLGRYRQVDEALSLLGGMFEASCALDAQRLPELFCGFPRRGGEGPTRYPVACAPQAWASGAVFLLLRACLGLEIDAPARRVALRYPALPVFLDWVEIDGLRAGPSKLSFRVERTRTDVAVSVVERQGDIEVVTYR